MKKLTVGSLFSGVGLCDLGLSWAGMRHAFFCEVDPFCRSVLAKHWSDVPIYNDVRSLNGADLPHIDILCGGFPCQDVSQGGRRAGIKEGTRSGLWYEYSRLIGEIRPRYAIIENVRGLNESWESTSNLSAYLIGLEYGLTGREKRPHGKHIAAPSFIEWMMGVPEGWTDPAA